MNRRLFLPGQTGLGSRRKQIITLIICVLVLSGTMILMVLEARLSPVVQTWAKTRGVNIATHAINLAVEEILTTQIKPGEIANMITDQDGKLQAIQYDMGAVNRLSAQASQSILRSLDGLEAQSFAIPMGQLIGWDFIAAWGPMLPLRMAPIGEVRTVPVGRFDDAGINQTWHRLFLDVDIVMRVLVPFVGQDMHVNSRIPILEEVIIGQVPQWYFVSNPGPSSGGDDWKDGNARPLSSAIEFNLPSGR